MVTNRELWSDLGVAWLDELDRYTGLTRNILVGIIKIDMSFSYKVTDLLWHEKAAVEEVPVTARREAG